MTLPLLLIHVPTGTVAARVARLNGFWAKGRGVLGRSALPPGEGVWLPGVASVHTLGVRFPLTLLFLDKHLRTLRVMEPVPPGRLWAGARGAFHTLELGVGTLSSLPVPVQTGDLWVLSPK